MTLVCQDPERYIEAWESYKNRNENLCFLVSNNLWFIMMRTQFYNLYNPSSKYKNNLYLLDNILVVLQGHSQLHIMNEWIVIIELKLAVNMLVSDMTAQYFTSTNNELQLCDNVVFVEKQHRKSLSFSRLAVSEPPYPLAQTISFWMFLSYI